jgi:hypothetical protein
MVTRRFAALTLALCLSSAVAEGQAVSPPAGRGMVVDDLFSINQLGDVALSPDGETVAVAIARPWNDGERESTWLFRRRRSG